MIIALMPARAFSVEVVGKQLEIYGVFHASLDYLDSDVNDEIADANQEDKLSAGDMSLSSNSSRIGFKGQHAVNDELTALFQLEQTIQLDGNNDSLTSRNSYVGLRGDWGEVLLGRYDTPFKMVGAKYAIMIDTVADRGAILGASATGGDQLNRRAENMLMWRKRVSVNEGSLDWVVQYSPDAAKSNGYVDNNNRSMWGVGTEWSGKTVSLAGAFDHWSGFSGGTVEAVRLGLRTRWKNATMGLIQENIRHELDAGGNGDLDRDAWGANIVIKTGSLAYNAQVLTAADYAESSDTGAVMFSVGVEKSFEKSFKAYLVYTQTDNDENAAFQAVDGTHGDELATLPGGTPKALSAGIAYAF